MRGELHGEGDPKDHTDVCPSTLHLALGRGGGAGVAFANGNQITPFPT